LKEENNRTVHAYEYSVTRDTDIECVMEYCSNVTFNWWEDIVP